MSLTAYAVRNSQFTLVVFAAFIALGVNSFLQIPRSEDPELDVPAFSIVVVNPGATAADLERLVARPLEDALKELEDIDKLRSVVQDGLAVVSVEFFYHTDPDKKYDDVLRQANLVRPELPAGVVEFKVDRVQTIDVAMLQTALVSETASYAVLQDLAEELKRRLETVPGVREAEKHAYPEKQVRVTLDLDRLQALALPFGSVIEAIQGDNANIPGGAVEAGARRFNLKTTGQYANLEEIRATPLRSTGAAVVRLGDVATVEWLYEEIEYIGRFNGRRAVFVTAEPMEGANLFPARDGLLRRLAEFRADSLPSDVSLEVVFDQTRNIDRRLGRLFHDFLIAFALVLLTVLPLGMRASLLVMVSIPLSLALGISALYFSGYSLNQLSIVGCVIALGLLVDDSIVVVENIARFRRQGLPAVEAAIRGTDQIAVAVVGTTFTLVLAFLPLLLLPGGPGQFIRSLPLAVVYTVLASMVVALTIIPFLASLLLRGRTDPEGNFLLRLLQGGIERFYRPVLHFCMRRRLLTAAACFLLAVASFSLLPQIGISLFPKAGIPEFLIRLEAEESASIAATDALARQVETVLAAHPRVAWHAVNIGKGNPQIYYNEIPSEQKAGVAEIFASLDTTEPHEVTATLEDLRARLNAIPGATILVKEFENGPPIEAPIAVRLFSENLDILAAEAAEIARLLNATEGTRNVDNPLRIRRTDLKLVVDPAAAGLADVAEIDLDRAVRLAFAGLNVSRFREEDGDEYNIQLALPRADRASLDNWAHVQVPTRSGRYLPINQVASLAMESSPPIIGRFDRARSTTVTAFVQEGYNVDRLTRALAAQLSTRAWPPGVRWEFGGEVESRSESFGGLGSAILLAVFGILAILVLEFKSWRGTLIVASVIPLGFIGGLLGLWLTGNSLSFMAAIGFVALIGIEIKNSILLVDFTNVLRAQGVPLEEAIERAGAIRFLPVFLTTITAIGALLPLAWENSGLYSPLAIVIIGGLLSSLLLSRLLTPVLYSLLPPPAPQT